MTVQYQRRRALALLALLALSVASCFGGDNKRAPTLAPAEPSPTSTPQAPARPPGCAEVPNDVCDTAAAVDASLAGGAVSGIDGEPFALEAFAQILRLGETFRVTSIGCPFAAVELGCGATFAVGVSSIAPGVDARDAKGLVYSFSFIRDAACDASVIYTTGAPEGGPSSLCLPDGMAGAPRLAQVIHLTGDQFVNEIVNGGLAQGGTLAGRPKGITDTNVRSEWFAYPDEPTPAVPDALRGITLRELELGPSVPLEGMLFIASGCWGCDGPTSGLDRVYRLGGAMVREEMTLPPGGIRSVAVRPNSQEVLLVTCDKDYCGGLGPGVTDMVSTLHRSLDGGVSWERVAEFDDYASVALLTVDGYLIRVETPSDDLSVWTTSHFLMPGRTPVSTPPGAGAYGSIRLLADGQVGFQSEDGRRWLREDGSVGYELPIAVEAERLSDVDTPGGGDFINWYVDMGTSGSTNFQVLWRNGSIEAAFQGDAGRIGQWLGPDSYVGNTFVSDKELGLPNSNLYEYERSVPAYVDLKAGVVNPIDTPFFEANYRMNRTYVLGSLPGEFVRVNTPGDCLNLRTLASATATALTCLKHGTLLALDGLGPSDDAAWVRVAGPRGQTGFVAAEYLER